MYSSRRNKNFPRGASLWGPSLYKSSIINTTKYHFFIPVLLNVYQFCTSQNEQKQTDTQTKKPSEAEEKIKLCFEIMSDDKNNNA